MDGGTLYLVVKAFHLIAVIAWMAGLLYLPRLYVYHALSKRGSQQSETFKVMERRLLRAITTPAMLAAWGFGLILIFYFGVIDWSQDGWFHAKLVLVILLTAYHGALGRWRREFDNDANKHNATFYRVVNEIPTLIMVLVVLLVIVKPF